ncbi:hypothetical protein LCGC14_0674710 [marine sediment metagenome]|uniref:Uncharacterized protein n=1 Tax=marine sediment metagenome TaxID=412755 RepID=A0A0F9QV30_9ZZZZ
MVFAEALVFWGRPIVFGAVYLILVCVIANFIAGIWANKHQR